MIIDIHTHAPYHRYSVPEDQVRFTTVSRPDRPLRAPSSWDSFNEATAAADKVVVFNIAPEPGADNQGLATPGSIVTGKPETAQQVNDNTAEFVRAYPDRLIGFLAVHPRDPSALDEIERCTQDLGMCGIKLGPNYQNFDPLGEHALKIYQRAQELQLPILLHQGTSPVRFADLDFGHPRHMDRVATMFPDLKLILAHMGHPWQMDCITVIRKHPNVYADISALYYRPWSWYNCMRLATEWGVLHKLLFGSDFGAATTRETIDGCRHVNDIVEGTALPRVPEQAIEELIHRDSLDLLGIG